MTSRPVQLANRGATGINLAFLARSRVPSVCPRPQFGRPVLCPGLISNLNFEISNPPRPFSLLPLAFRLSEVSRVTIGSSARRYRVTSSTPAPPPTCCLTTRHSHLTLVFSQISNLKFQIPFGLSHDPSLIPQYPSVIPEYPPLSRNIPPYPRIPPPPIFVRNQFQPNYIQPGISTQLKIAPLISNHLRICAKVKTNRAASPSSKPPA